MKKWVFLILLLAPFQFLYSQADTFLLIKRNIDIIKTSGKTQKAVVTLSIQQKNSNTGFFKLSEKLSGLSNVVLISKLRSDIAIFKSDTLITWIFPEISNDYELNYTGQLIDTIISFKSNSLNERNHITNVNLASDTVIYFTPKLNLLANNKIKEDEKRIQNEKSEEDRKRIEENNKIKKEEVEKSPINQFKKALEICNYRIQLSASVNRQNHQYFIKKLPNGSLVHEEKIDQWFKYVTGCFSSQDEAIKYIAQLVSLGFKKPFVVKYENEVRVK